MADVKGLREKVSLMIIIVTITLHSRYHDDSYEQWQQYSI